MLSLLDRHTVPPGGYRYFQAETKTTLAASTLLDLARDVITHRHSNGVEGQSDEELVMREVEDQLCRVLPPGICRDVAGQKVVSAMVMNFDAIRQGTMTLLGFLAGGAKRVEKVLANARAKTCAGCFANVDPSGECTTCSKGAFENMAREAAGAIVGAEPTDYDGYLKACAYCACGLKAKVWLPIELLRQHTPHEQMAQLPDHCWLRTE